MNLDVRYAGNSLEGKELVAAALETNIGVSPYARQYEKHDGQRKARFAP